MLFYDLVVWTTHWRKLLALGMLHLESSRCTGHVSHCVCDRKFSVLPLVLMSQKEIIFSLELAALALEGRGEGGFPKAHKVVVGVLIWVVQVGPPLKFILFLPKAFFVLCSWYALFSSISVQCWGQRERLSTQSSARAAHFLLVIERWLAFKCTWGCFQRLESFHCSKNIPNLYLDYISLKWLLKYYLHCFHLFFHMVHTSNSIRKFTMFHIYHFSIP